MHAVDSFLLSIKINLFSRLPRFEASPALRLPSSWGAHLAGWHAIDGEMTER